MTRATTNMGMHDWNEGTDPFKREHMSGNFNAIDSEFGDRGINVKWLEVKADYDTDDTQALINAFGSLKDGDTLIFPPQGRCRTNMIAGYLITLASRKNIKIIGNDCVIEVADQGFNFNNCSNLRISRLKLERKTQAVWSSGKTGLSIVNTTNVEVDRCEVSKFTDALSLTSCTNARAYKNVMHDLGEEPFAVRTSKNVVIEENEAYNYLGDGVLNKGSADMSVIRNYLHCENTKSSNPTLWNILSGGNAAAPVQGGGVTSNAEDGTYTNLNMTIDDNRCYSTLYGIILSGITGAKIINNRIKDVGASSGIAFSGSATYNPNLTPNYDVIIAFNHVDNLLNPGAQYGLYFKSAAVASDRAVVVGNTIRPNGPHKGITLDGNCHAFGNTIDKAEVLLELSNGAKASNNTILDTFVPEFGRALSLYDYATAINNTITSSASVQLWGKCSTLANNTIRSTATINTWAVYLLSGANKNNIKDNIISSACGKEIAGADANWRDNNQYSGILERGGSQYWNPAPLIPYLTRPSVLEFGRVSGAQILDTTLGLPVIWNVDHWIEGNYGRVTISGDGTSTTYQIPHGLSAAPLYCNVVPSTSAAANAGVKYVDSNATNITVHFTNPLPSGTNNIVLYWEAKIK